MNLRPHLLGASLALAVAPCAAAMSDPTRPPAGMIEGREEAAQPALPVLQSVIIGKTNRAAIIDGQRVELGGRFRGAKVVSITEEAVALREGGTTQVLKMYPDVEKRPVRGAPPPKSAQPKGRQP